MKRLNLYLSVIAFMLVVTFVGCTKTTEITSVENSEQITQETVQDYTLPDLLKTGVTVENGIMVFKDAENYFEITELLISENKKWNEDFYQKWKDLGEDGLNAKIEELNFDCEYSYQVFEKYHEFISLRSKIKEARDKWLGHEELDMKNNPNTYAIPENERAVYNEFGEFIVGNNICHIKKEGVLYEISKENFSLLEKIRNNEIDNSKVYDNIKIYNTDNSSSKYDCVYNGQSSVMIINYGSSNKMEVEANYSGYTGLGTSRGHGTMRTYKKKSGVWKSWNTDQIMSFSTKFYSLWCGENNIGWKSDSDHQSNSSVMSCGVNVVGSYKTTAEECYGGFRISGQAQVLCFLSY